MMLCPKCLSHLVEEDGFYFCAQCEYKVSKEELIGWWNR